MAVKVVVYFVTEQYKIPVYNTEKSFSGTICPLWEVWVTICSCLGCYIFSPL